MLGRFFWNFLGVCTMSSTAAHNTPRYFLCRLLCNGPHICFQSKTSKVSEAKQRLMCVQLPLDAEPADIENFEFSTLRLRPPLCQSGSVIWNTQASDGFEITGLSPSHQERVRLFFLSMRYDAGNLSAESLERVRFFCAAFALACDTVFEGQTVGSQGRYVPVDTFRLEQHMEGAAAFEKH